MAGGALWHQNTMTMKTLLPALLLTLLTSAVHAQSRFPKQQLSVNGFRNPSIGLEYQRYNLSVHAGYYVTNFESGVTTEFAKAGSPTGSHRWGRRRTPVPSTRS